LLSKTPHLKRSWANYVRRHNELTSLNRLIPANILSLLHNNKDIVLHNSPQFPMPAGITDLALEKDEKLGKYRVSVYFKADEEGVGLYKECAKQLDGRHGIELKNRISHGFLSVSMDWEVYQKIRAAGKFISSPMRD
jgi:hypothetical protein